MIGTTLLHYKITAKLGEGGMGEVYLAQDTKLKREVALKILAPEMASDPERLARFHREAEAVAALNHPSIVSIFSVEEDQGVHFITMEKVEGNSLDQRIPTSDFELSQFFDLAVPLAEAVAAAHDRGITHRDLKPANVMVDNDDRIRVLDFGLAKVAAPADVGATELPTLAATREGLALGTVPYMSPEQAQGLPVDHRTDVFSLGVMLYEMVAGQRPFQGETSAALVSSILKDTPPTITELRSDLPNHLRRVIERCLEKKAGERYQSARDLAIELKGLRREFEEGRLLSSSGMRPGVVASSDLAVGVLSIQAPAGDDDLVELAEGLTEDITTGLAGFSYLTVVSGSPEGDARAAARELGVRYLLRGRVRRSGSTIRFNVQLVDTATGGHLWAESYDRDLGASSLFEIQDEVTDRVVATVADQQGVLIRTIGASLRDKPIDELAALEAVFLIFDYWHLITPETHAHVRDVFERVVETEPNSADSWAGLSIMYCEEYKHDFNARPDPLGRALETARRAVDLDRTNQLAFYALAQTEFFRGDAGAFRVAAEKAVQLNRRDGNTVAFMGILRCYLGEWETGTALIRQALKLNPHFPGWYKFGLFWDHYRKAEYREALKMAQEINLPGYYPTHVAVAAAAGRLGLTSVAKSAVQDLRAVYPAFVERGRTELGKWVRDEEVLDATFEGLRLAGLETADGQPVKTVESDPPTAPSQTASPAKKATAPQSRGMGLAVLPFNHDEADRTVAGLVRGLAEDVATGLARFSYLSITEGPSPETSADSLGARFLLTGGLRRSGDALRLNVRITDAIKGQRLWSETYNRDLGETSVFQIQDDLTGCVVATIADAYGVLVRSMADLLQDKSADELSASEWVLRLYGYRQRVAPDEHAEMRAGLEKAVKREPRNADVWASLCQIYIDEDSFGFNLRPGALDRALDAARRAVDIDRTSQLGYQVLAQTHFFRRDLSAFRPAAERAMELNPLDSNTIGILGLMIVHTGEFDRGADLTRRAMKLNPHHAGWYHFGPLWQHFHNGNFEKALARVNQVNMPGQFWQYLATAAICAHLDRREEARVAVQELLAVDPDFASHARQNIESWHFASGLLEPLVAGLRKAGLEVPEEEGSSR